MAEAVPVHFYRERPRTLTAVQVPQDLEGMLEVVGIYGGHLEANILSRAVVVGNKRARPGYWVAKDDDSEIHVFSPEEFKARFEAADA